jgi:CRISPR-associated protein Cmr5
MSIRANRVAAAAYRQVEARKSGAAAERKKYGAIAHKLPGMILQNGLAQATGFLLAKGKDQSNDHHSWLLDDLNTVLRAAGVLDAPDRTELHRRVIGADLGQTLTLTRAALDASAWLKRYVQGLLRVSATGDAADGTEDR